MAKRPSIKELYYITHILNIPSMLKYGVLSHAAVDAAKLTFHANI